MQYTIVTVNENTPEYLEYGDYRGLVVVDPQGVFVAEAKDMDHAQRIAAAELSVDAGRISVKRTHDYDGYGASYDVSVDES
jgi:hypothetical protein